MRAINVYHYYYHYYFVFGHQTDKLNTYFTHEPSCLVFAMFLYPVINCQGLSSLLGSLAVRLNKLETALIYNNKIKRIQDCLSGLSSSRSDVNK